MLKYYLSCFICVRDGDSIRGVWDIVKRLVLMNILRYQTIVTIHEIIYIYINIKRLDNNAKLKNTYGTEREGQCLQDV